MPTSPQSLAELLQAFAHRQAGQAPGAGQMQQPTSTGVGGMGPQTNQNGANVEAGAPPSDTDQTGQGAPGTAQGGPGSLSLDMPPHIGIRAFSNTPEGQKMLGNVMKAVGGGSDKKSTPRKPAKRPPPTS